MNETISGRGVPWLVLALLLAVPAIGVGEDAGSAPAPAAAPAPAQPHNLPAGTNCMRCHDPANFATIKADQVHQGHFPLQGEHATLACSACHDTQVGFGNVVAECAACHKARDGHLRLVGDDCAACHDPRGWVPNRFRHVTTGFPLTGAHRGASCEQCHAAGFTVVPTECAYCHERDFYRARDEHEGVDILSCDLCHDTFGWGNAHRPHGGGHDD